MPRPQQFIIQNPQGNFYTLCDIVGAVDRIEQDGTGNKYVHSRHLLAPRFDSNNLGNCSKFSTEADALGMMQHPDLKDPDAFSGCTVVDADTL